MATKPQGIGKNEPEHDEASLVVLGELPPPAASFAVKASDLEAIRTAVVDAAAVSAGAESGNRRAARRQRNVATESEFGAWSGAIEETGDGEYAIPPSGRPIIVGATSQMAFARSPRITRSQQMRRILVDGDFADRRCRKAIRHSRLDHRRRASEE